MAGSHSKQQPELSTTDLPVPNPATEYHRAWASDVLLMCGSCGDKVCTVTTLSHKAPTILTASLKEVMHGGKHRPLLLLLLLPSHCISCDMVGLSPYMHGSA